MWLSLKAVWLCVCLLPLLAGGFGGVPGIRSREETTPKRVSRQDVVTFDKHSILIRGGRIMIFSGEVHPFRLPVPGLWLDVFQKIKAMGFNTVSFYVVWGLVEGKCGSVRLDGVFALEEVFQAAVKAGIYLIARPGSYINAEVAAGGFPGWTLRINCTLRSLCPEYLHATNDYMAIVGKAIADAQIAKGGPVILVQPENEYSSYPGLTSGLEQYQNHTFPDAMNKQYMAYVEQQPLDADIVVPLLDNDNYVMGNFAPGTGVGAVDLYAFDAYPLRYDCANPTIWPTDRFPRDWNTVHDIVSPSTPFVIAEFQGGSVTPYDGVNQEPCNALINEEAVRVLYKNNYSFGLKLFSIYMTYGGTNWGNLGYMGGDTSYDYGAAITEDRHVWREKYSEEKLQANFFKVSPAWLTAIPGNATNGTYASTNAVTVTPLRDSESRTAFYVVRQANFSSTGNVTYKLSVSTSVGNLTVPQLGGELSLFGRNSKTYVTDYNVGGVNLIYSTAEIFTWARDIRGHGVLLLYGGEGETHEFALPVSEGPLVMIEGSGLKIERKGTANIVQWTVGRSRKVLLAGDNGLTIFLLWRNEAYNHWIIELPANAPIGKFSSPSKNVVVVKPGYLVRTASFTSNILSLTGDINVTTDFELLYEPTGLVDQVYFNDVHLNNSRSSYGTLKATVSFEFPYLSSIDLLSRPWRLTDSLPEIQSTYDDTLWTSCNHSTSTNNQRNPTTPSSLCASAYDYHIGSLPCRGYFVEGPSSSDTSTITEPPTLFLNVSGGYAFGYTLFLNNTFLGSFIGTSTPQLHAQNFTLPTLIPGGSYTITLLIDHMSQTEEGPGTDTIKFPIGILDHSFSGFFQSAIRWVMTGNLHGKNYIDLLRGPRN